MEDRQKRLTRSRDDRMLAGVAGGIGKYFDTDPTLIRLIFVVAAFATDGLMIWIYILMAIVVPEEKKADTAYPASRENGVVRDAEEDLGEDVEDVRETDVYTGTENPSLNPAPAREKADPAVWVGIGLVLLGLFLLVDRLGWFWWLNWSILWPVLIVLMGLWVILRRRR